MEQNAIGGLSFRIAAILICITCIFYTAVMRKYTRKKLRSRLFLSLFIITMYDSFTGIITLLVRTGRLPDMAKRIIANICETTYHLTRLAFVPIMFMYVVMVAEIYHRFSKRKIILIASPFILLAAVLLTNPFNGFFFTFDENLVYVRGKGVYLLYILSGLYLGAGIYFLLRYWKSLDRMHKAAMAYFLGLAVAGVVIQGIYPDIVCELLAESLGLMGVMIMIERDEYRLDYKTHVNNRVALVHDVKTYLEIGRKFHVICIRVINAEIYRRTMGYDGYDDVMLKIADFLMNIDLKYDTYRTTAGNFFLICPDVSDDSVTLVLDRIKERFANSFDIGNTSTIVKVRVLCAKCPDELGEVDDILLLSEANLDGTEKMMLRGSDLDFLLRRIEVEKAIVRGVSGDSFKVMYQPVYSKEDLSIRSAEARLTMNDPELGEVSFDEFMSVAEATGFVDVLQNRVIESVIKFINDGIVKSEIEITAIMIHIMSVQVLKHELTERVKQLIDRYEIMKPYVFFDVSDIVVMQAQEVVKSIADDFEDMDIHFMLVNHDAGFIGISSDIIDIFHGINIDVSKHYNGVDYRQADIVLRNRCAMVRQLGKLVILSGVDSKELFETVRDIPADFVFGNYLSRQVTKNELQTKFWHKENLQYLIRK